MDSFPPDKKCCHLTGFKKYCRGLVMSGACQNRWVGILGQDPQTGKELNHFGCIDDHAVMMQLDHTRKLNGMQAAIESFRNESLKVTQQHMLQAAQQHRERVALMIEEQVREPVKLNGYVDQLALELKSEN